MEWLELELVILEFDECSISVSIESEFEESLEECLLVTDFLDIMNNFERVPANTDITLL